MVVVLPDTYGERTDEVRGCVTLVVLLEFSPRVDMSLLPTIMTFSVYQ